MAHSSLLGVQPADAEPAGRDAAALGPSDSSDSGSDVAGLPDTDAATDAAGTGEIRSADGNAGLVDAADIGVDRVFVPGLDDGDALIPDVDIDAVDADADAAALATAPVPPGPGRRSPEPDVPASPVPGEGDNIPGGDGEQDAEDGEGGDRHRPGRDPLKARRLGAQRGGRSLPGGAPRRR